MTMRDPADPIAVPQDQAQGLRRMFAARDRRFVPLVHNPFVPYGGVAMERLCAAWAERGLHTLVVDAADTAAAPHELSRVDLSACIEPVSRSVSFLAARGLPLRWLENNGSTAGFLAALADAAPQADVVLLHAGASDLGRLFAARKPRPVLLAADHPDSLTHAYASMKLLAQRLGVLAFDLLLAAEAAPQRTAAIATRLAGCADRFLAAALGEWAVADPGVDADAPDAALRRLAAAQLGASDDAAPWPHAVSYDAGRGIDAQAN
jgi:flagellar biosynthesis protein FlhG